MDPVFRNVNIIEKIEKLYKRLQNFNEKNLVKHNYNSHLMKSFIIVICHLVFMRFIKRALKMKNDPGEAITIIDLSSNIIAFIAIMRKIYYRC